MVFYAEAKETVNRRGGGRLETMVEGDRAGAARELLRRAW